MKSRNKLRVCVLSLSLACACALVQAQDVVIIANKSLSFSQMTSAQLRDIFIGARSQFADGTRAIPTVLKGGPVHEVFLRNHVQDNPDEFRVRWRKVVFTGQGAMLKEFTSESALFEYVVATPGAIGYVSRVSDPSAVRVLTVEH